MLLGLAFTFLWALAMIPLGAAFARAPRAPAEPDPIGDDPGVDVDGDA